MAQEVTVPTVPRDPVNEGKPFPRMSRKIADHLTCSAKQEIFFSDPTRTWDPKDH